MTKNTNIIAIVIVILIVGVIICLPPPQKDIVKIGVIAPSTGALASFGDEVRKGVVEGSKDSKVEFIFEDDQCDPKMAVSAFQKLTSVDGAKFIIGPGCGSPQEAIVPLLKDKNVLAIVPSAASKELFEKSGQLFFNIQYSLENESKFIAEQMYARGYKNVAIVTYGNAFSKTHHDSFKANFRGTIAVDTVLLDDNANLLPELTKINSAKVDAIYAPDITFFFSSGLAKMGQLSMKTPVFGTYVVELPIARPFVDNVIYSFPEEVSGVQGGVFELSKESTVLLLKAISSCGNDVACVRKKLVSSGQFDESGTSKRGMMMKQIVKGEPVNFK
jgi:hypothetical protein